MSVFRIEKTKNYTVMSNYHLRDITLSLKAKGLLSLMLSLPDEWDYTTKGLAKICKDGVDSICATVNELEKAGYVTRHRIRNEKGQLSSIEYVITEIPKTPTQSEDEPKRENPVLDNPVLGKPRLENPAQLNTNILNTKELNKDISYPIQSEPDSMGCDAYETYKQIIKDNIEYDILLQDEYINKAMLDEIVELITETVCSSKKILTVSKDDYPSEVVRTRLLKLNSSHIQYVLDCMKENTSNVRNIKKYMLASLFNAPATMDSYYTARVNRDLYGAR